jgi:phosphoribosylformimino-5-aminoimidazole carboxamide ribotide isomerase
MLVMPAIDLRDGACVQLVGGDYAQEAVRWPDARAAAAHWLAQGFRALHVVDLDAATGRGDNRDLAAALASTPGVHETQVGGGVRDDRSLDALVAAGATRVVVGTRALEDPAWLERSAARLPGRIVVAADVRDGRIVTRGWQGTLARPLDEVLAMLRPLPLAGVLVTAVHREGLMQGPDLPLLARVVSAAGHPVQASGGISTFEDLRALDHLGIAAVVLGMALYTGTLDARRLTQEYPS